MDSFTANNSGANTGQNQVVSYLIGTGFINQLILSIVLAAALYIFMMMLEVVYYSFRAVGGTRKDLLMMTVNAQDKPRQFLQDPANPKSQTLLFSDNEVTGVEYSYSFFLFINPASFRSEEGLLHIMHKGHPFYYPLMSPGVFLHSNTNTLRVYQNSSRTWNTYVDIENIPVKKWVHIAIVARKNAVEVYVNGNVAKKLPMVNSVIYQNYGDLFLFSQRTTAPIMSPLQNTGTFPQVFGTYNGQMSNLVYFSYALSYTEIQSMNISGVNSKTDVQTMEQPPYLADNWWVGGGSA
jgi:hypothetical protein